MVCVVVRGLLSEKGLISVLGTPFRQRYTDVLRTVSLGCAKLPEGFMDRAEFSKGLFYFFGSTGKDYGSAYVHLTDKKTVENIKW